MGVGGKADVGATFNRADMDMGVPAPAPEPAHGMPEAALGGGGSEGREAAASAGCNMARS